MFFIKNAENGGIIERRKSITLVKQQERIDLPLAKPDLTLDEADGVILSDGETMLGIAGRGMDNYTPLVTVEEVSGEPYMFRDLDTVKQQGTETGTQLDAQQQLQLAGMQGQSDTYAAILAMQETINAQQQLILANMQGLSDVYASILALQTTGTTGTEA